jgi:hypothetical protein
MGKRLSDVDIARYHRDGFLRRPRTDHGEAGQAAHAKAVARFRAQNVEEMARYEAAS